MEVVKFCGGNEILEQDQCISFQWVIATRLNISCESVQEITNDRLGVWHTKRVARRIHDNKSLHALNFLNRLVQIPMICTSYDETIILINIIQKVNSNQNSDYLIYC